MESQPETLEQLPELVQDEVDLMHRPPLDGIEKILWWVRSTNICEIEIIDHKMNDHFRVEVPNDEALHAFNHPFLYRPEGSDGK